MVAVRISPFGAMIPAVDDGLLPETHAADALNTYVYKGVVVGLPELKFLRALDDPNATKVYRIPKSSTDASYLLDSTWMEFGHPETDVIRSQVAGDTFERYYWASPADVPRYNTKSRIENGDHDYILGVTQPGNITVTPTGGVSATLVSRSYVITYVSAYGEEGPPSNPYLVTGAKIDATFGITLPAAPPADLGTDRNLTRTRIYRTITSVSGVTTYFLVADVAIGTASYNDTATDATVSGNAQLESTNWTGPPSDLQGWVTIGNGMVAGWRNNEIWFCEPYRMHAWPAIYTLVVEYPIVGMGVINQTLVVLTQGFPHTVTGINPSAMSVIKLAGLLPCTSRGSIVSAVEGVFYSSPQGLVLVSSGGAAVVVTEEMIRKDRWRSLVPVATLRAVRLGQAYYCFGSARFGAFDVDGFDNDAFAQEDLSGARSGALMDVKNNLAAFSRLSSEDSVVNVVMDAWSGEVLVIKNENVYWLDMADGQQARAPFLWKSKLFQTQFQKNFQAMKVYFTVPPGTTALDPVPDTSQIQSLKPGQWGLVRFYADGELKMTRELRASGELFRMPSGYKADYCQWEVEARVQIDNIQSATSVAELRGV